MKVKIDIVDETKAPAAREYPWFGVTPEGDVVVFDEYDDGIYLSGDMTGGKPDLADPSEFVAFTGKITITVE